MILVLSLALARLLRDILVQIGWFIEALNTELLENNSKLHSNINYGRVYLR